ncbi:50S ribosomal protein L24e [Candidatus Woesearchaeota archaeon]|nr:50S ribosomal protein L24e [Candidatus Woesearchaeota archaeon]
MAKCRFCGETIKSGTGKMYVKSDGTIFYFCKSKCEKNMLKLGRKPAKIKWTKECQENKEVKK